MSKSSILVKGMEMPKGCTDCFMSQGCRLFLKDRQKRRHPNCPLVEIHGRLINANDLKTAFPICENSTNIKVSAVRRVIDCAQTIVGDS